MKKVWLRKSHKKKVLSGQKRTFRTRAYKEKQSAAQVKRWKNKQRRQAQNKALGKAWSRKRNAWSAAIRDSNDEDLRAKKSRTRKTRMRDDATFGQEGIAKVLAKKIMSAPEKQMKTLLKLLDLPYEFVGNGKLMIGRYCPDFVRIDVKAIIEVYGFHHSLPSNVKHDKKRKRYILSQGYKMLVVKAEELADLEKLVSKIKRFDEQVLLSILRINHTQTPSRKQKVKV